MTSIISDINSFPGMALWGEPTKGVLYWEASNLVNFSSLASPLRLFLCTNLVFSNCHWGFRGCFQNLSSSFMPRLRTKYWLQIKLLVFEI